MLKLPGDAVLSVDGALYSMDDLVLYVGLVLGIQPQEGEVLQYLPKLAMDLAGAEEALAESPALNDDPAVLDSVRKLRSRLLKQIYEREEIAAKVNPSEEDLLAMLPDPTPKYDVSVIVLKDEGKVRTVLDAMANGETFEECARKHSDGMTAEKGGSVGLLEEDNNLYTEEEFSNIRALGEGEVSAPFRTRIGWNIARLNRYWSPQDQKREDVRQNRERYERRLEAQRYRESVARLSGEARIEWNEEIIAQIKERAGRGEPIPRELLRTPFVTVNGSPLYPSDLGQVAVFHGEPDLEKYLDRRVEEEIVSQEALRLGYGERIGKILEIQRKHAVTRQFIRGMGDSVRVGDEELERYRSENPEEFRREEVRRILVIECDEEGDAETAAREIREGGIQFRDAASRYNRSEEARKAGGDAGFLAKRFLHPDVAGAVFGAEEGAILGPLRVRNAQGEEFFVLIRVEQIEGERVLRLEELDDERIQAVRNRVAARKMEKLNREFMQRAAERHEVRMVTAEQGGGDR